MKKSNKKIAIYYAIQSNDTPIDSEPNLKVDYIYATSRDYYDENHCLDDGSGDHYNDVAAAFREYGVYEIMESVYEVAGGTAQKIINAMIDDGYIMISDEDFDEMCCEMRCDLFDESTPCEPSDQVFKQMFHSVMTGNIKLNMNDDAQ